MKQSETSADTWRKKSNKSGCSAVGFSGDKKLTTPEAAQTLRSNAKKITLACTLVYFASYIMRINFAVMIAKICSDMSLEKSELSIVLTALTIAYGTGQIISGILGDKFKPAVMLSVGLALAAACNIAMFFAKDIPYMVTVWCINGFAHSMLWPPIVRIFSTYLNDYEYSYASVRVSWGSSVATVLLYLICPLLIGPGLDLGWNTVMLICAGVGIAVLAFWIRISPRILVNPIVKTEDKNSGKKAIHKKLPAYVFVAVVFIMLGIIFQGALRDGVTNWIPSFLSETFGISEERAIVSTVILAIFSIFSFWIFGFVQRMLFKNEVMCASVIFALSTVLATVLYFINTLTEGSMAVSLILMSLIVACMHGVNLMLIGIVPKRFVKSGKVSTYSGILNACTYIGAAISTYVFALFAEKRGWDFTIFTWIIISALGLVSCLVAVRIWKRFVKEYAEAPESPGDGTDQETESADDVDSMD